MRQGHPKAADLAAGVAALDRGLEAAIPAPARDGRHDCDGAHHCRERDDRVCRGHKVQQHIKACDHEGPCERRACDVAAQLSPAAAPTATGFITGLGLVQPGLERGHLGQQLLDCRRRLVLAIANGNVGVELNEACGAERRAATGSIGGGQTFFPESGGRLPGSSGYPMPLYVALVVRA